MNNLISVTGVAAVSLTLMLSACSTQEEMAPKPAPKPAAPAAPAPAAKAESKAPAEKTAEKAKATKIAGDIGLLDTEKNYLILVTKEGKLVTVDFDSKYQPVEKTPHPAKITDIGLVLLRSCNIPSKATRTSLRALNLCRPKANKATVSNDARIGQKEKNMSMKLNLSTAAGVLSAIFVAVPDLPKRKKPNMKSLRRPKRRRLLAISVY